MADTEARIRAAAIRLWAERGFHGSGIRELAEAAGVSSATLYHYMGTKEDLLAAIMRDGLLRLLELARAAVKPAQGTEERLSALVQLHVLTHAVRPEQTRVVDWEMRSLSTEHAAEIVALRDEYELLWQEAIDEGCRSGLFRPAHPRVARLALLEMCNGVAHWYTPDGPLTLEELALRHTEMALALLGVAVPVGVDVVRRCRDLITLMWTD
ncbi:TetR/AcrR family transcriptional regulator [Kutzneria viridogrisea]|uniref:TetR family transcription regulator n=2 Tax=Kutzneria TaxID=43356 RepID=W5WEQ2_9PSEU|nr:TetR/AcrR family transcriptional regulator [Kutzneria albida]AHH96619.1 TetR family transcription regulator [Kutzneria albida DSM 43870]MBA8928160.1 AcrR family transcriptional regulator [Kutzneria viridogrisea]